MPCYDERNSPEYISKEYEQKIARLEAMLCALLSAIENEYSIGHKNHPIHRVNEKEAGITRNNIRQWWVNHKAEDARRKQREQELKQRKIDKNKALSKLTDKEKKLLGLI